jgi:hypothetical protein
LDWIKKDGYDVKKATKILKQWGKETSKMNDEQFQQWQKRILALIFLNLCRKRVVTNDD